MTLRRRREAAPERKNYKNNKRAGGRGVESYSNPHSFSITYETPSIPTISYCSRQLIKGGGGAMPERGDGRGIKCRVSNHAEPLVVVSRCVSSPMVSLLYVGVNTIYKHSAQHLSIKVSFKANFILQKSFSSFSCVYK